MGGLNFDINSYLRLDVMDILMTCISTLIIVFIAKRFFWDKVTDYLNRRHAVIQEELDAAAKERTEAVQLKAQYDMQMANAKAEAHKIVEAAKDTAAAEKKDILQKAVVQAESIKEKAFADIEREKQQAQKEMKDAITDVAFEAAKKIVKAELDETKQKQYIKDFMEHAGDDSWPA